jgi:hypothetical protein
MPLDWIRCHHQGRFAMIGMLSVLKVMVSRPPG